MLYKYSLSPDIFDIDSYGKNDLDESGKHQICSAYLKTLITILVEEAIIVDLQQGKLCNFIKQIPSKHPNTKQLFLKLLRWHKVASCSQDILSKYEDRWEKPYKDWCQEVYKDWCQEAIRVHQQEILTGIISSTAIKKSFEDNDIVASIEKLDKATWWNERSSSVRLRRNTDEYIKLLKPIFCYSNSLMFIDPYLNPRDKESRRNLIRLIEAIPQKRPPIKIEFHVSNSHDNVDNYKKNFDEIMGMKKNDLRMELFIWDDFHDRYLISDLIGISIPYGFATNRSPQITTWTRLGRHDKDEIQREFHPAAKIHKLIEKVEL